MRSLLNDLSKYLPFRSILLKYSINDLIILNSTHLPKLIDVSNSALIIDLNTLTITECHTVLNEIRNHLLWIDHQQNQQIDFDDETNEEWTKLIRPMNHTTTFGYLLGYPIVYYYASETLTNATTLKNFRLYVKLADVDDEILLYSFSSPVHDNINEKTVDDVINQWFSSLSLKMNSSDIVKHYHLEHQIREQTTWCF
ncbi:unnamed protein product [Adineta ricciae]|uniref:Uncharacterized protein n=1 Tax=Adineta ricciae TaxID=249248 RepID=A0A813TDJ7_ADIRI|nr:unnamed protein product [Adineta ricciae]CAF1051828.1 unnamed protein product [Adineta ricciae]